MLTIALYCTGFRYQAGWFRLIQRNQADAPQRNAAARAAPEPRQPQNNENHDDGRPEPNDDTQVINSLT